MTGQVAALARQIIDRVYPVSVIVEFAAETDPNAAIGCGTVWTRMEDGRALIASDVSHPVGWTGGTESVTLTVEQIAAHYHDGYMLGLGGSTDAPAYYATLNQSSYTYNYEKTTPNTLKVAITTKEGGGQPHSNMQPSLAVCRWQRVA